MTTNPFEGDVVEKMGRRHGWLDMIRLNPYAVVDPGNHHGNTAQGADRVHMKANTVSENDSSRWLVLGAFVVLVVAVGGLIGATSLPDAWYSALHKAPWNPPNWVFGPVWLLLYVLIAIAGARTWLRYPGGVSMGLWIVQMLLNWSWSPLWFRMHAAWLAFAVIVAVFVSIVGFIWMSWRTDRASALLFLPYALWVGFASSLNLWIAVFD